ncbi:MAG: hypothetical protein BGO41_13270 [Clostridiales bacterium 38-18]|nr:MAG: hypothetical protein BGO41_13270 [Clostridiales bacterium 38-18]
MLYKGIVLSVHENYSIILTNDNQYKRIKNKAGLLVGQKIWVNSEDLYTANNNIISMFNRRSIVAAAALIAIVFSSLFGLNLYQMSYATATVVTIDINPSVQLELNANDKVLRYTALNEDAASLALEAIKGMSVEDAVETVVSLAIENGFIDSEDLIDDYVLVTTIPVKRSLKNDVTVSNIESKLEEKITDSEILQEVNVAYNKATKDDLKAAKDKSVSVGLYVLDQGSDQTNVKEYFSEEAMINQFERFGTIIQKSDQAKVNEINKLLNTLETLNVDISAFRAKLALADVNYDSLIEELKGFIEQQENETNVSPSSPETSNDNMKHNNDNNNSGGKNNGSNGKNNSENKDKVKPTEPTSESIESPSELTTEPSTEPETKNPSGKPIVPKNNKGDKENTNKGNTKGNTKGN